MEDVKKEIDHLEKKHGEMESGSDGEVDDIENKGDEEKKKK